MGKNGYVYHMNSRLGQKKQEKLYMTENVAIALTLKLGVICHEAGWRRRFMYIRVSVQYVQYHLHVPLYVCTPYCSIHIP